MRPSVLATPFRSLARPRPRRRRASHLAAAALVALAWAGPAATPARAEDPASYAACVGMVTEWVQQCYEDNNFVGDVGCFVLGVGGLVVCVVIEAIEKIGESVGLP